MVRRHQRHVVKRREQNAAVHSPQMHEQIEVAIYRRCRLRTIRWGWTEPVFGSTAKLLHMPRQVKVGDDLGDAVGPRRSQRDSNGKILLTQARGQRGPNCGDSESVAGQRSTDARCIDRIRTESESEPVRDLGGHAVCRSRHAPTDGLADHDEVGIDFPRARGATGTHADGVRLIDDQQHAVLAREFAYRGQIARLRQHDADVGERWLHEHTGNIATRERLLERIDVVELNHPGGERRIYLRTKRARASDNSARFIKHSKRFVDCAVVAPVHDDDLAAPGEMPSEPQHKPIRVGCGHCHLPRGQPEPASEFAADPRCVVVGQHRGDAAQRLAIERLGNGHKPMANHCSGVAEAEVVVLDAIDISEVSAVRLAKEERKGSRPTTHPRHRNPAEQVLPCRVR